MKNNQNGNALLYVLIAVGLMAALTYAVTRDNSGQQADRMDDTRADLYATELLSHVASAEQAIYHMIQWGTDIDDLKFDLPGSVGYDTDVTNQVYHPQGGGLQVMQTKSGMLSGSERGWQWQNAVNVEWSPTAGVDLIVSFVDIDTLICEKINDKLLKNATIPTTIIAYDETFVNGGTDSDFEISSCAACENTKSICINDGTSNAFYTIIGSR